MNRSIHEVMSYLIHQLKPLQKDILLGIVCGTLGSLCVTGLTVSAGYGILQIIGYRKNMSLFWICFAIAACAVILTLLHRIEDVSDRKVIQKTPELIMHAKEAGLPEDFAVHTIKPVWTAVIYTVIVVIMMAQCSIMLALLALASYLVCGIALPLIVNAVSIDVHQETREETERMQQMLDDENSSPDMIREKTEDLLEVKEEQQRIDSRSEAIVSLLSGAFAIMMIVAAIVLYWQGRLHFDGALIAVMLFMSSFGPVSALVQTVGILQDTAAAGNRLMDRQEEEETV